MSTAFYMSTNNGELRYVDTSGIIHWLSGSLTGDATFTSNQSVGTTYQGMAFDAAGNLYLCDSDHGLYKMDRSFNVTTLLGNTTALGPESGFPTGSTSVAVPAPSVHLSCRGVALDSAGNIYVTGLTGHIFCINMQSTAQTICGISIPANSMMSIATYAGGVQSGNAVQVASNGDVFFINGQFLSKINHSTGTVTNIVGTGTGSGGTGDGGAPLSASVFFTGFILDANNNPIWAETSAIRAANLGASTVSILGVSVPANTVARIAGTYGTDGYTGDGSAASGALLSKIQALGIDPSNGTVAMTPGDTGGTTDETRVRAINSTGIIATIAGTGVNTFTLGGTGNGGPATSAEIGAATRDIAYQPAPALPTSISLTSTGTVDHIGAAQAFPASYAFIKPEIIELDPSTSAAWIASGMTATLFGAKFN